MERKYKNLFTPIKLGNTVFRNRIFASPVSLPDFSNTVGMTDRQKAFYAERARGGAASVATGDGVVHSETGFMHSYKLQLDNEGIYPSLSDMARLIRMYGAVPTMELSHGGKFANVSNFIGNMETGKKAYGPDHEFTANGEEIFEMPREMILEIAEAYGKAAGRAKAAGFGMVLIHAGHGWLLQQFMSPRTNHRTDEFGGSFENRMRFTLMVIEKGRAAVGAGFPIEFRMSGAEFTEGGYGLNYGIKIAQAVDGLVDLIHVSAGVHDNTATFTITHPTMFREHGCNVYLAAEIKRAVKTPVAAIGALSDPDMLEDIIASGAADVVEMGRQLMADPFLPRKIEEGREKDITRCIRCFACMQQLKCGSSMRCAVNPRIGREELQEAPAASKPKTVLVAGGGPAGMSAALEASRRGHKVIIFEKTGALGGETRFEEHVDFKKDMYRLGQTFARRIEESDVEVRLGCALTPEIAEEIKPDAIISAVGASPLKLNIPGADGANVRCITDLLGREPDIAESVVIIGGGLVGMETAIHFAIDGRTVRVIEMLPEAAGDAAWPHRFHIMELAEKYGIEIHTGYTAKEITDEGVIAEDSEGNERLIEGRTVFMAAGLKAEREASDALRGCAPVFREVGDVVRPAQLFEAISGGYFAGREI